MPLNKPFSVISDPAFTEANKALEHLQTDLRKTGNIACVLEPRNGKKPTSNKQMKKLFDSAELLPTESKNPAQLHLPGSLFRPTKTRESTPANASNSVLAKNPWRG